MSSPQVYLLQDNTIHDLFKLLNWEITFDVDVSKVPAGRNLRLYVILIANRASLFGANWRSTVPCGINGALYLSGVGPTGGASALNAAGAKYGTGYRDA